MLPIVFAASSSPRSYTTSFAGTENPISEKGNWVNGKSVGLDWSDVASSPGLASGTQTGTVGQDQSVALLAGTWASDQTIQAKVHSVNQNDGVYEEVGVVLRGTLAAHNFTGYEVKFRCLKSGAAYAKIIRRNGTLGSMAVLKSATGAQYGVAEGDVVKATAVGNVITAYINGTQVLQVKDGTFTSGAPGMSVNLQGATGLNGDYGFASLTATESSAKTATTSTTSTATTATATAAATTTWKYSTNFPATENPISEGGHWINGLTAGIDWENVRTTPGFAFGTETGSVNYNDSTALLTGTWGPDQTVQATVRSVNPNSNIFEEVELRLRSNLSAHSATGYEINFRCLKTSQAYAQIVRWNGALGSFTYLDARDGSQYGVASGDVVKATIVGNVITAYINGNQILQVTDSKFSSGKPGIGFYNQGGTSSTNADYGFTNFMASDGTSGSSAPAAPTNLSATPH